MNKTSSEKNKMKLDEIIKIKLFEFRKIKISKISKIERTHLSLNDVSLGYWSWLVRVEKNNGGCFLVGSSEKVSDILKWDIQLIMVVVAPTEGFELILNKQKTGETK